MIAVAAGVVCREGRIMICQRKPGGHQPLKWEFPGGKLEPGETPQQALAREIKEELGAEIRVGEWIHTIEYDYPAFHLSMDCFWCEVSKGNLVLLEAEDARWLTRKQLHDVLWLPADAALIPEIEKQMN